MPPRRSTTGSAATSDDAATTAPDVAPAHAATADVAAVATVDADDSTAAATAVVQNVASGAAARAMSSAEPRPSFARGLWRIAAAHASSGNRVALLRDGPQTFDAMLDAIHTATRWVFLESYIYRADTVGMRFRDALVAAARRGVEVSLLTDWIGARGTPGSLWQEMRDEGVVVRIFSPPALRSWLGLLPRDHRKLLVVDERVGVTGGIGIAEDWAETDGRRRSRSRWRDTAVRIEGPAAADMARAFQSMWKRAIQRERRDAARRLVRRASGADVNPDVHEGAVVGIVEGEPWRLRVARALQLQAVSAERTIWIASAYFVPSVAEIEALAGAARDGVDVRILVPSKYDHPWVRGLTRRAYRRLVRNGVRIYEWQGTMMHAKTSVVDGRWVRVGSTDFNPLGVVINYELDAVIEDRRLGADAQEMFLADLEQSVEITPATMPSPD
ncbi:MAG TPA: phosphatidylserine/phosphatidylglycerophosphate/cardiolipin synthase family protein [Gemmatimonadaceae bacterium]|nr:phosphatidylserine/phosphatidylglycerophosphate/cardiolipin synthase family protein [Gemmatimonadaceae bacterium]